MRPIGLIFGAVLLLTVISGRTYAVKDSQEDSGMRETATLGGGCFWCLEAVFEELKGVYRAESGYAGGNGPTTYREVCDGETGHAEVVQVTFDPEVISFQELLAVFFSIHDPTTLNRQGADVGTQYRSVIFHESESQKQLAQDVMNQLKEDKVFNKRVVTELSPLDRFFKAEQYHQDYYRNNQSQSYCQAVINPKLAHFRQKFSHMRK